MLDARFRNVHRLARASGRLSGFSTLEEGMRQSGSCFPHLEYQAVLIPNGCGVITSVRASELDNPEFGSVEQMFRAAHRYAIRHNAVTGFPLFEQGLENQVLYYGIAILNSSVVDVRSIPARDLGNPSFEDVVSMFISVHRYARDLNSGFVSGYPLFERQYENGVLHYGIALVKASADLQLLPADLLSLYEKNPPNPGTLILVTDNGIPSQTGGVRITNESPRPATIASAGALSLNFEPNSAAGVAQINDRRPVSVLTYDIRPGLIPLNSGQLTLADPGDAMPEGKHYAISPNGQIISS